MRGENFIDSDKTRFKVFVFYKEPEKEREHFINIFTYQRHSANQENSREQHFSIDKSN